MTGLKKVSGRFRPADGKVWEVPAGEWLLEWRSATNVFVTVVVRGIYLSIDGVEFNPDPTKGPVGPVSVDSHEIELSPTEARKLAAKLLALADGYEYEFDPSCER